MSGDASPSARKSVAFTFVFEGFDDRRLQQEEEDSRFTGNKKNKKNKRSLAQFRYLNRNSFSESKVCSGNFAAAKHWFRSDEPGGGISY